MLNAPHGILPCCPMFTICMHMYLSPFLTHPSSSLLPLTPPPHSSPSPLPTPHSSPSPLPSSLLPLTTFSLLPLPSLLLSHLLIEYLALFSQLIAFHDPELFVHLADIGFQPQVSSSVQLDADGYTQQSNRC